MSAFRPDRIPPKVEEKGGGFMGRPLRDVWISGMGIALGLIAALWLPAPVWLKVAVAVLLAGLGLAIGLGRDQGTWRFEERLVHFLRHRARPRVRTWRRPAAGEETAVAVPQPAPAPVPADEREGFGRVHPLVDLWWGIVTAFVMSLMGGVTAYLASGGAQDLFLWWQFVTRGS
ncbi:MAG TPA: hypothetical protein ENI39_04655 [Anaerolineae bacterium]|nr:hypothetical protein [Anaerolineae bacterium]